MGFHSYFLLIKYGRKRRHVRAYFIHSYMFHTFVHASLHVKNMHAKLYICMQINFFFEKLCMYMNRTSLKLWTHSCMACIVLISFATRAEKKGIIPVYLRTRKKLKMKGEKTHNFRKWSKNIVASNGGNFILSSRVIHLQAWHRKVWYYSRNKFGNFLTKFLPASGSWERKSTSDLNQNLSIAFKEIKTFTRRGCFILQMKKIFTSSFFIISK